MIYLVHGDDVAKSRSLILNQQSKLNIEKRTEIDLSDVSPAEILEKASSEDLFGGKPFIVLNVTGASKTLQDTLIDILPKIPDKAVLIILSNKELPKSSQLPAEVSKNKGSVRLSNKIIEGDIFRFIDYIFSKNRALSYKEYEKLLRNDTDPLYLFSMISYGLRNISIMLFDSPSAQKMNPFVKMKTAKLINLYSEKSIKEIYAYLYELEKRAKTGTVGPDILVTLAMEKVLNS